MYGNPQGLGVVNVAMANYAKEFNNAAFVRSLLAPTVPVYRRSMQYLIFDRANQRVMPTLRSPGQAPTQLSMSYSTDFYVCQERSAEIALPRETQQVTAELGFIATQKATRDVMQTIWLRAEAELVSLLTSSVTNISTPTTPNLWDAATADPVAQIEALRYTILEAGVDANTLILGPDMYKAARLNPNVIEKFKYTAGGVITDQDLALAFGVDKVVRANAVSLNGLDQAPAGASPFLWKGIAVLAYVQDATSEADISALKTFVDVTQGIEGYEVLEFPDAHLSKKVDYVSGAVAYDMKVTAQETVGVIQNGTSQTV